jgi:hypothetical protein
MFSCKTTNFERHFQAMSLKNVAQKCGQWDSYRTNFDDFRVVHLFGKQADIE